MWQCYSLHSFKICHHTDTMQNNILYYMITRPIPQPVNNQYCHQKGQNRRDFFKVN